MSLPDPLRVASGRLAYYSRQDGRGDPAKAAAARRDMAAARLERAIRDALCASPPPSIQQRERLAALLMGGAR